MNTHVTASISVLPLASLTIAAGVTVTFDPGTSQTIADTALFTAVGTAGSPIVFKAATDLSADYATGTECSAWRYIDIATGGVATIKYATIQDNFTGGIDATTFSLAVILNNTFGVNDWWKSNSVDGVTHGTNSLYDIDILEIPTSSKQGAR